MKDLKIVGGTFSKKGNFTASTAKGKKVFVSGSLMKSIGITTDEEVKPFYLIADNVMINQLEKEPDENGVQQPILNADGTPLQVPRFTALSVYKTKDELVEAYVEEATLDFDIAKAIKEHATSAGLTEKQIEELANQSW
jgi:hypothetical protein